MRALQAAPAGPAGGAPTQHSPPGKAPSTAAVLEASILGLAIWGPGLEGWAASRAVLAGDAPHHPRPSPPPPPAILPPTERRRAGPVIRLALAVAQEAAAASGLLPASLRSVFGSSNGDGVVVGSILDAMARGAPGERVVSPTQFHNSVHNAAAGYWCIANGSRQPATCLGAHDSTWAAALLKAMVDVAAEGEPVLLVCYDHPLPPPLDALRPTGAAFAAGLVLAPEGSGPRLRLRLTAGSAPEPAAPLPHGLDALMRSNAAARALPLLCGLARGGVQRHTLDYLGLTLGIESHRVMRGARLAALLPHAGAMVLLDGVLAWNATWLRAHSRAHLDPANPLRRGGRLSTLCGVEFALQAAALHGAMRAGGVAQQAGYVARLRGVALHADRLDDPALGTLDIHACLEHAEAGGMLYALRIDDVRGRTLVEARASIALPTPALPTPALPTPALPTPAVPA